MPATILPICGKTLTAVKGIDASDVWFYCDDGTVYRMFHYQDCCESVSIAQVDGDIADLIGAPLSMAEESFESDEDYDYGSRGWTFYRFATVKGYVTIRWIGESNGYYSIGVNFDQESVQDYESEQDYDA